jgi:hypothetical protein
VKQHVRPPSRRARDPLASSAMVIAKARVAGGNTYSLKAGSYDFATDKGLGSARGAGTGIILRVAEAKTRSRGSPATHVTPTQASLN